jgi:hypothetical protein
VSPSHNVLVDIVEGLICLVGTGHEEVCLSVNALKSWINEVGFTVLVRITSVH